MKLFARILSLLVLAGLATFYVSCSKDDGGKKSDEEVQLGLLTQTWTMTSATSDGTSRTADYPGLKLTISGTFAQGGVYDYSLTMTGAPPSVMPWPQSGKWKFGTNPKTDIIRDPGVDSETSMTYTLSSDGKQLHVEFTLAPGSGWNWSRQASVSGAWVFEFSKQ
jgi:hypothetical protein